ncbi:MAG: DUF1080 domain-containing protein [Oligoflexales bacterium]
MSNRIKDVMVLIGLGLSQFSTALAQDADGLGDWNAIGNANWTVADGEIHANSGQGYLVTKASYKDFDISLEFQPGENTNSGVFLRCADPGAVTDTSCYEANVFDHRPDQTGRTGAIVNLVPPRVSINTEGHWNTYEISARGDRLIVRLNGVETVDVRDARLPEGPIALQFFAGDIRFRNIVIQAGPNLSRDLVGVWDLEGLNLDDGKGNNEPWCDGAFGSITYFSGQVSLGINCSSDSSKTLLYSGSYSIEGENVVHAVRNYSDASLNKSLRHKVVMTDMDHLVLVGPFGDGGSLIASWVRREVKK